MKIKQVCEEEIAKTSNYARTRKYAKERLEM
jgi:hypothetical protein